MVTIQSGSETEVIKEGIKTPVKETLLTPRFYTTDFDAVAKMDISSQAAKNVNLPTAQATAK